MDFQKTTKNKLFENVHHSRVPNPFWPKRVADRTPITTEGCVFRRGLKSGPREPKERKSAPVRFLEALNKLGIKIEENNGAKTIVFYEAKRPSRKKGAKKRALIFQKTMRLCSARGLL